MQGSLGQVPSQGNQQWFLPWTRFEQANSFQVWLETSGCPWSAFNGGWGGLVERRRDAGAIISCVLKGKPQASRVKITDIWGWREEVGSGPGNNLQEDFLLFRSRVGGHFFIWLWAICACGFPAAALRAPRIPHTQWPGSLSEKQSRYQPAIELCHDCTTSSTTRTPRALCQQFYKTDLLESPRLHPSWLPYT